MESLGEERDAATAALAQEVERLRGLIRQFTGPAPSPSMLQAVHLEAFKKGPNPVVLRILEGGRHSRPQTGDSAGSTTPMLKTVRSAPSLHLPPAAQQGRQEAARKPLTDAQGRAQARSAPRAVPAWRGLRGARVAPSFS